MGMGKVDLYCHDCGSQKVSVDMRELGSISICDECGSKNIASDEKVSFAYAVKGFFCVLFTKLGEAFDPDK